MFWAEQYDTDRAGKGLGTSVKVSSNESGKGLGCFSFLLPDEDRCILYE